jgi:hypothetical protein
MSKLILRSLISNDKFTFDKHYDSQNGDKGANIAGGHWIKNDKGNLTYIPGEQIKTGLNDDGKTDFRFELMFQFDAAGLSSKISEQVGGGIKSACKPGGVIHSAFKGHGFAGGSIYDVIKNATVNNAIIASAAKPKENGMHINETGDRVEFWNNGRCTLRVGNLGYKANPSVQEIKAPEHDKALSEMDKHLPAYRRSDKGFQLSESVEWLGKLNAAHEKDCIKYEAIIENLMEAFDIKTVDGMAHFASNLRRSAEIIDSVRKK